MQAQKFKPPSPNPKKIGQRKPPNPIKHFHLDYDLPKWATIDNFQKVHKTGTSKPKNKHKLTRFTYYKHSDKLMKVLYLNQSLIIDQGTYPFTDPSGAIVDINKIEGDLVRVIYLEMVYIGHYVEKSEKGDVTMLVLKKITEAKIDPQTSELETINDNFEILPVGNEERFNQFLKVQQLNPNASGMSIRVMVDEKFGEEKEVQVIDFQFFKREETLKANKKYQLENEKKE